MRSIAGLKMLASVEEDFHLEWTKKRGAAQRRSRSGDRDALGKTEDSAPSAVVGVSGEDPLHSLHFNKLASASHRMRNPLGPSRPEGR
jgi:hypothetical protein